MAGMEAVPEPSLAMVECAANWIGRLHEPGASAEDRDGCARWRGEHPSHELAWQRMHALWQGFGDCAGLSGAASVAAIEAGSTAAARARRRLRQRTLAAAGMVAIAAVLALAAPMERPLGYWLADERSAIGERRVVQLPDDSQFTLDSGSAADVRYDARQRRIALRHGTVLLDVARDPQRPFVVETPQGTARAMGTRYTVSRQGDATFVAVLESRVEVCRESVRAAGEQDCRQLLAGQQVRLDAAGLGPVETVDAEAAAAWTQGQLSADNQPVAQVLEVLQRHRSGTIRFDPQALEDIRVSGVLPLDDTDRALEVLAATLPLRVTRFTPWWVVVQRKP